MDSTDALSRSGCRERRLNKTVMSDYIKLHSGFRFAYLKLTYDFLVQKISKYGLAAAHLLTASQ